MSRNKTPVKEHFNTPLSKCPNIRSYLKRHDAWFKGMRKASVFDDYGGYTRVIGTITFTDEGEVAASDPDFAPTEAERIFIQAEVCAAKMPKPRSAPKTVGRPEELEVDRRNGKAVVYSAKDRNGDDLMILARYEQEGTKWFIPYSYWDDDEWRKCEPDGPLPLWGIENITSGCRVFVHEGFKAAAACQSIASPQRVLEKKVAKDHPFAEYLSTGVHVGWHGGAPNPQRSDWAALKKHGAGEVIIVTDNDDVGRKAATTISRKVELPAKLMQFTEEFPSGFDLADEFPKSMFKVENEQKRYTGPLPEELLHPATWATRAVPTGQGNKVTYGPTENFLNEWVFISGLGLFVHKDFPAMRLTTAMFNGQLRRFSDLRDVADLLIKQRVKEVPQICYRPESPGGLVNASNGQAFNVFAPSRIKPEAGDATPFLEFITYLVPDPEEAREVMRWCATLIAKPEVRMEYALLLISEMQGTGKTTLAERILKPLVGPHNTCIPSETMIVSDFNDWASCRRLVVVSEIYQGHTWKPYNRLKALITDRTIRVNEKHKPPYDIENRIQIVACSNSPRALKLEGSDRRWYVPTLTEDPWPRERFEFFNSWLTSGGLERIAYWAAEFGAYVTPGSSAPKSVAKDRMISDSHSEHVKEAIEMVEGLLEENRPHAIRLSQLVSAAKQARRERCYDEGRDFCKALVRAGWVRFGDRLTFDRRKDNVLMNPAAAKAMNAVTQHKTRRLREIVDETCFDGSPM